MGCKAGAVVVADVFVLGKGLRQSGMWVMRGMQVMENNAIDGSMPGLWCVLCVIEHLQCEVDVQCRCCLM